MAVTSSPPDAGRIAAMLPAATLWRSVAVIETTGSTNADLAARARAGEGEGAVLVSMEQTAGRGRLDRQWASPRGTSISMSLLLTPQPEFAQWGWLSLLAGMAVASAVGDARAGSIVLMHDIHAPTLDAVPRVVAGLRERGFTLVTVSQLLGPQEPGSVSSRRP